MSFVQRLISVQLQLANGQFAGGGNSITLSGLRCQMRIDLVGGATNSTLEGVIYGMTLSEMNQLSTVGLQLYAQAKNTITVMAGDAQSGMALVYQGTLTAAYVDAQAMPQVNFRVSGTAGKYEALMPTQPISMQGTDVATIFGQIAQAMDMQFENNGVSKQLSNVYLYGSPRTQAFTLAQHAGVEHIIDRGTLAIWNPGQPRQGAPVMISPQTGMVGYPLFNQAEVIVKTVYDPAFKYGGSVQIQSDLTPACGTWTIKYALLELDSMTPHGRWFATLSCVNPQATQISGSA